MANVKLHKRSDVYSQTIDRDIDPQKTPRLDGDGMEEISLKSRQTDGHSSQNHYQTPQNFYRDLLTPNSTVSKESIDKLKENVISQNSSVRISRKKSSGIHFEEFNREKKRLEEEKLQMKSELDVQVQVNQELKKLLVASVGSDLEAKFESLARDKAVLAQDLDYTVNTLSEERENLSQFAIQCDVWRSKFLGSRVQVDELLSWKRDATLMYEECSQALANLLEEVNSIRPPLMESHGFLQYLSSALHRSHSLTESTGDTTTNVVTLAEVNRKLSQQIFNLLLGDVGRPIHKATQGPDSDVELTLAQLVAAKVLANRGSMYPGGGGGHLSLQNNSPSQGPLTHVVNRFHPVTRYENLTINCCERCKGEIKVL